jgi:hypothetical protein
VHFLRILQWWGKTTKGPISLPSPPPRIVCDRWSKTTTFFRRQSDSSLIVGCIIDPRPDLRALSIDPFVPCVTHWYTIYNHYSTLFFFNHVQKDGRFASRCHSKSTCFSGSKNTQKLLLRDKTISHPNWREEVLQNTRLLVISCLWCYFEHCLCSECASTLGKLNQTRDSHRGQTNFSACAVWMHTQSNITNIIFTWVHNTNTHS